MDYLYIVNVIIYQKIIYVYFNLIYIPQYYLLQKKKEKQTVLLDKSLVIIPSRMLVVQTPLLMWDTTLFLQNKYPVQYHKGSTVRLLRRVQYHKGSTVRLPHRDLVQGQDKWEHQGNFLE